MTLILNLKKKEEKKDTGANFILLIFPYIENLFEFLNL